MPNVEEILFPRKKERAEERRRERTHRDVLDEVFDRSTLLAVSRLVSRGFLSEVDYSISTGKEANVFRATSRAGFRALKIYRISNATFRNLPPYALEDLRREVGGGSFGRIIFAWARREFMALKACHKEGVPVPAPIVQHRNLLLMEFLGREGLPSPPLQRVVLEDPQETYRQICEASRAMVDRVGLVHGDLSPYNVLFHEGHPYLIDLGQTISRDHPQARELLERDAAHFARYFARWGIPADVPGTFRAMGGDRIP